jgi:hypothetical protein
MLPPDHIFRISFRLCGKEFELISVGPGADQARRALGGLSPQIQVLRVDDLGLRDEMDEAEFESLWQETPEW